MPDTTKSVRAAATRVGMFPPPNLLGRGPETARQFLAQAADAGIDYVCCGDHVSFFGIGSDGLVQATVLAMLHPTLPIHIGVYLLPLRRPVLVARQLLTGTADDVAEFLTPYADAGCTEFNLIPQSPDHDQAIAGVAAVKKLLART
jgi:alkanesulfonate monooxygenase SsuD/methylene tetrahydromethanopterin reductase-like flavin-dependent oxidoreductase (luciferase family)